MIVEESSNLVNSEARAMPFTVEQQSEMAAIWRAIEESSAWRKNIKPGVYYVVQNNETGKLFAGFHGKKAKWTDRADKACMFLLPYDLTTSYLNGRYNEKATQIPLDEWLSNRPVKRTHRARVINPQETAVIENMQTDLRELVLMLQAGKVSDSLQLAEGLLCVVNQ